MRFLIGLLFITMLALFCFGCSLTGKASPEAAIVKAENVPIAKVPSLNEAKQIMVESMLSDAWKQDFSAEFQRSPVLIIGDMEADSEPKVTVQELTELIIKAKSVIIALPGDRNMPLMVPENNEAALELKKLSSADYYLQSQIFIRNNKHYLEMNLLDLNSFNAVWSKVLEFENNRK
ncbi:MAG: hypothetical protein PHO32_00080 [Candidatus Cloacimonetes bacterium]|nr:hypothetical protein [Candidatus Cloacimonadota bacterium]